MSWNFLILEIPHVPLGTPALSCNCVATFPSIVLPNLVLFQLGSESSLALVGWLGLWTQLALCRDLPGLLAQRCCPPAAAIPRCHSKPVSLHLMQSAKISFSADWDRPFSASSQISVLVRSQLHLPLVSREWRMTRLKLVRKPSLSHQLLSPTNLVAMACRMPLVEECFPVPRSTTAHTYLEKVPELENSLPLGLTNRKRWSPPRAVYCETDWRTVSGNSRYCYPMALLSWPVRSTDRFCISWWRIWPIRPLRRWERFVDSAGLCPRFPQPVSLRPVSVFLIPGLSARSGDKSAQAVSRAEFMPFTTSSTTLRTLIRGLCKAGGFLCTPHCVSSHIQYLLSRSVFQPGQFSHTGHVHFW